MFKENTAHLSKDLSCYKSLLSEEEQIKIEQSEGYSFYQDIFCQINESLFSCLYCDNNGRPNAPINSMIGALILMPRKDLSYNELFEQIRYNMEIRASLGLFDFKGMPFSQSTLFNFQNKLSDYEKDSGINLFESVFDTWTLEQIKSHDIKTDIGRMDSFFAPSNIRNPSRLSLLIEVVIRVYRILNKEDKERFASKFADYTGQTSEHYIYQLKPSDLSHEKKKITELFEWLINNIPREYHEQDVYKTFKKVYNDHFLRDANEELFLIPGKEVSSGSIQSPDDTDATYRRKDDKESKGQIANIVETANPENKINLIYDVTIDTNNTDDSTILNNRAERLKEKAPDLNELHHNDGYSSEDKDKDLKKLNIIPIQTAVRGRDARVEINIEQDDEGNYKVSCPEQDNAEVEPTRKGYKAKFDSDRCEGCPFKNEGCPCQDRKDHRVFYFKDEDHDRQKRHRNIKQIPVERRKIRSNVEASVAEFSRHMPHRKLKVRGAFKASVFAFMVGFSINFGRIHRFKTKNNSTKA